MDIFKLVGSVWVDTNEANKSLQKTQDETNKTGNKFKDGLTKAAKFGAAVVGAATVAGAGLMKLANNAAQTADEIDKGSSRMGVSKKYFQELKYAAGQCGIEMTTMEKAAKKLEGTDLNMDQAMQQIMALTTEEERSAKAAELFGDSVAYQLSPMLAMTGDEMNNLMGNAESLGLVMSDDAVNAGVKMGDTMSDVKQSLGAVGTQIGSAVMPVIQQLLEWILAHMPEIQAVIGQIMDFITTKAIPAICTAIEYVSPIAEQAFNGIIWAWDNVLKPVIDAIIKVFDGTFKEKIVGAFQHVKDKASEIFNNMVDAVKAPVNSIIKLINKAISGINSVGFDIPDFLGGGHVGFSIPTIPQLAKGGNIVGAGNAIVGERGAELINLPKGATVTPLNGSNGQIGDVIKLMEGFKRDMYDAVSMALSDGIDMKWDGRNLGRLWKEGARNA